MRSRKANHDTKHCQTRLPELNTALKQGVGGMGEATKSAASLQGGTGVFFNRHGSLKLRILRGFRLSGGPAPAADP